MRLSLYYLIGQGSKGPDGGHHQQHAEEDRQFLPAKTREDMPQIQGPVVSPESHVFPLCNVHGEGRQHTIYETAVPGNHIIMAITHGLLYSPLGKYTVIAAGGDADAALWKALTIG